MLSKHCINCPNPWTWFLNNSFLKELEFVETQFIQEPKQRKPKINLEHWSMLESFQNSFYGASEVDLVWADYPVEHLLSILLRLSVEQSVLGEEGCHNGGPCVCV